MSIKTSRVSRKNGFLLPITTILITFGTITLFTAGLIISRTTDSLKSFSISSDTQIAAANAVEIAANSFMEMNLDDVSESGWAGFDELRSFVTNRGGYEGNLWGRLINGIGDDEEYIDLTGVFSEYPYSNDAAFADGYAPGAVAHAFAGDKYLIVAWASKDGVKRYAIGLVAAVPAGGGEPAIRFGEINRVLSPMHSSNGNDNGGGNPKIYGDMVYGNSIVINNLELTDDATLAEIFTGDVTTQSVNENSNGIGYTKWSGTSPEASITEWREEYLAGLPEDIIEFPINDQLSIDSLNAETLLIIDPPINAFDYEPFRISFHSGGAEISCDWRVPNNKNKNKLDTYSSSLFIPKTTASGDAINIRLNGDTTIGTDQNHKTEVVDGKYTFTVYGDINITSNLFYEDIFSYINNGNGNSPVSNKAKDVTEDILAEMIKGIEDDYLGLAAIGGNINFEFDHPGGDHGDRSAAGDFMAFEEGGSGGNIGFPDFASSVHGSGHTPQFFALGSITASTFDADGNLGDDLSSLVIAAVNLNGGTSPQPGGYVQKLLGMRVW